MFCRSETPFMQRLAILAASLIGLACCALAVIAMHAQQAEDLAVVRLAPALSAHPHETHHLRTSLSRASVAPAPVQRIDANRHILADTPPPHAYRRRVTFPHPPKAARAALTRLVRQDPDLRRIEAEAGPLPWRVRDAGFSGLLNAIVGQQISNQAAAAIWGRCRALRDCLTPEGFLALDETELRAAGLSRPKIAHGRAVAEAFGNGTLATDALAAMSDEDAVRTISSVKGLGVWSAEIYLLFALQRNDVFPAGDLALQCAAAHIKNLPSRPTPLALREIATAWQPNRALAARLLWHWWRHVTGRPSMDDEPIINPPAG